jgi:hypothetical protein
MERRLDTKPETVTQVEVPIVCPICWGHDVVRLDGIQLSAAPMGGRALSEVSVYHCDHWHLLALFNQPATWEEF